MENFVNNSSIYLIDNENNNKTLSSSSEIEEYDTPSENSLNENEKKSSVSTESLLLQVTDSSKLLSNKSRGLKIRSASSHDKFKKMNWIIEQYKNDSRNSNAPSLIETINNFDKKLNYSSDVKIISKIKNELEPFCSKLSELSGKLRALSLMQKSIDKNLTNNNLKFNNNNNLLTDKMIFGKAVYGHMSDVNICGGKKLALSHKSQITFQDEFKKYHQYTANIDMCQEKFSQTDNKTLTLGSIDKTIKIIDDLSNNNCKKNISIINDKSVNSNIKLGNNLTIKKSIRGMTYSPKDFATI